MDARNKYLNGGQDYNDYNNHRNRNRHNNRNDRAGTRTIRRRHVNSKEQNADAKFARSQAPAWNCERADSHNFIAKSLFHEANLIR